MANPNVKIGIHTYKEMYNMFGEKEKSGNAKRLQMENWKRYCEYGRPTKQKFNVLEVYETPKEKIDGRKNNGRTSETKEEFDYLIYTFIDREIKRNMYHVADSNHKTMLCAYFTNSEIADYFGLYDKTKLYSGKDDTGIDQPTYQAVIDKVIAKRRNLIIDKIKRLPWLDTEKMVMVYKGAKGTTPLYYGGDYYDDYIEMRKRYVSEQGMSNLGDVIKQNKWQEMLETLTLEFNERFSDKIGTATHVETCTRIIPKKNCGETPDFEYTLEGIEEMKHLFNLKCARSLIQVMNKEAEVRGYKNIPEIITKYVLLDDWRDYTYLKDRLMNPACLI